MIAEDDPINRIDQRQEETLQNRPASGEEQILRVARLLGRQAAEDLFHHLRPANDNVPATGEWSLAA
jgi:hypothetical protein